MGMIDFAGSTVVHSVGGWAALAGAVVLGPRIGKYVDNGEEGKKISKAIPGHNMPLAALGVFILWFGWFGFNPGSTTSGTNLGIAMIAVTTNLAAAAGAIAAMFTAWARYGKPDASMSLNGALAGLVAITAPCSVVSPVSAIIIGLGGGVLVVISVDVIDKVLHIDDPVGAISVHGVCGAYGTLSAGLFAQAEYAVAAGGDPVNGLFFGGGMGQFGVQMVGVLSVFAWTGIMAFLLFFIIKKDHRPPGQQGRGNAGARPRGTRHGVLFRVPDLLEPIGRPARSNKEDMPNETDSRIYPTGKVKRCETSAHRCRRREDVGHQRPRLRTAGRIHRELPRGDHGGQPAQEGKTRDRCKRELCRRHRRGNS